MSKEIETTADGGSVDRRALLRVMASAAVLVPTGAYAQPTERAGSVEDIRGEAYAVREAARRELERTAPLFINELVGTGADSRLTMHLGKDTTLRLGAQARLTLDRLLVNAGGEVTLQSGPMLFNRPAGSAPARMQIQTSYGLIAVRGTRFFAGPSAGVFGVFVERGNVVVSAASRNVTLRAGQGTNIAAPGDAPTPAAPWKPERIRAAFESVT
jgi:hypothetical protein